MPGMGRAAVILAAGHGTRMKSPIPKVLHKVGGRTMLDLIIDTAQAAGCERIVVVVGAGPTPERAAAVARLGEGAIAVQDPPLGTGHAVLAAKAVLQDFDGDVLVTNANCPLLRAEDLEPLFAMRGEGARLALLGFEPADQLLYGRLIRDGAGEVLKIVEPSQCTEEERAVRACYSGMLAADRKDLFGWLARVTNDNPKGEYFLTSIVALAVADGASVRAAIAPETAVMGADTPTQLAAAEAVFQQRSRARFLAEGVYMAVPETVVLSWDTELSPGEEVPPFTYFRPRDTATRAQISGIQADSVAEQNELPDPQRAALKLLRELTNKAITKFHAEDWISLATLTGGHDVIEENDLIGARRVSSFDYSKLAWRAIFDLYKADPENLGIIQSKIDSMPERTISLSAPSRSRRIEFAPIVYSIPNYEPDPELVCAMMPFADAFDDVYETILRAATDAGGACLRGDKVWDDFAIAQDVFSLIYRSGIVVCDFTNHKPDVFYEAGIANTLGKYVVPISQNVEDLKFYFQNHRAILYNNSPDGLDRLFDKLTERFKALLSRNEHGPM